VSNEQDKSITPTSIKLYLASIRSYFAYYDVDIIPSKFKRKVKLPKVYREDEEPLDVSDIRKILLSCNNRRLKPYLLVLASGGMRTVEVDWRWGVFWRQGQKHADSSAAAGFALDVNQPAVRAHDVVHGGQTDAGTLAGLGRKKGLE